MARLIGSLKKLRDEANTVAPNRNRGSDGWIGNPEHAARHSDHNPEPDGTVDAIDITHDPAGGWDCEARVNEIIASQNPHVSYLIWRGRITSGRKGPSPWVKRSYGGSNGHYGHMHVSGLDADQDGMQPWLREFLNNPEEAMATFGEGEKQQLFQWLSDIRTGVAALNEKYDADRAKVPATMDQPGVDAAAIADEFYRRLRD